MAVYPRGRVDAPTDPAERDSLEVTEPYQLGNGETYGPPTRPYRSQAVSPGALRGVHLPHRHYPAQASVCAEGGQTIRVVLDPCQPPPTRRRGLSGRLGFASGEGVFYEPQFVSYLLTCGTEVIRIGDVLGECV